MRSIFLISSVLSLFVNSLSAQSIKTLNKSGKISLRGLSVVNDHVIWVAGSKIGKSTDAGKTWEWITLGKYPNAEFRDIEAFSEDVAIIMSVGEPAYILKTIDGGNTWKEVYKNATKGMFLDAMDFADDVDGIVLGDPIDGKFFLAKTIDGGDTWLELNRFPKPDSTEACFASSGTNIRVFNKDQIAFITGGVVSNLILGREKKQKLPILQGTSSTGANSIAIKDSLNYIVVGGDFTNTEAGPNCVITNDGGKTWTFPEKGPEGYKSCVEYLYGDTWVCCGLTGVDISTDNGKTWKQISKDSYHTCRKAKNGNKVFLSGNESRIGVLTE